MKKYKWIPYMAALWAMLFVMGLVFDYGNLRRMSVLQFIAFEAIASLSFIVWIALLMWILRNLFRTLEEE